MLAILAGLWLGWQTGVIMALIAIIHLILGFKIQSHKERFPFLIAGLVILFLPVFGWLDSCLNEYQSVAGKGTRPVLGTGVFN